LTDLHTLSIGDNHLAEVPEAIGDMTALADLSLYGNQLRDLPKSLAKLPLTFLHLGDHQWEEPPAVVGECMQLETLWIASRALKRLPAAICKLPKLRQLMLWYSSVTEVPDEIFEMKQLEELRIKNNPLPDEVYKKLAEALPNTKIY
jgi:internalin A